MRILVIGENCIDKFVYGSIDRICPEAPVPVLNPIESTTNNGMAGNTVDNIKALAPAAIVGHVKQPENIVKTRYVEKKSNQMVVRVDEGESNIQKLDWNEDLEKMIAGSDIVVVSDYNKGFLTNEHIHKIGQLAKLSIIDSKRFLKPEIIEGFTFIKLNEKERIANAGLDHPGIITTLGSKGAEYQNVLFPSPNPQETIDVSGAGDTFTSSFILKYFKTNDIRMSMKFANEMAAYVVSKRGVATPDAHFS